MNNKVRVLFMGTPRCAVPILTMLGENQKVNLLGVVSQPDKPKGRKGVLSPSPVKEYALAQNFLVMTPQNIRKDVDFIEFIRNELKPDIVVVVAFGQILPQSFLDIPQYGCINLHFSLLPKYRGAAPVSWSIINGESLTGVTLMAMNNKMDEGDILAQIECPIDVTDTRETLETKLAFHATNLLENNLGNILNKTITPKTQDAAEATYAPRLSTSLGHLQWIDPADKLARLIRALNPDPMSYSHINNLRVRILEARIGSSENRHQSDTCGMIKSIIKGDSGGIEVITGRGTLVLQTLQPDGKKSMRAVDFANGQRLKAGDFFQTI